MKGILLAGGNGTRLAPLTKVVNKHLLPIYNQPMIAYPLETLKRAGATDILIVTGHEHVGRFLEYLGDGSQFGVRLTFRVQESASGIAGALQLGEEFAGGDPVSVILGDNIFSSSFTPTPSSYGCTLYLTEVSEEDAKRFGCAEVSGDKVIGVEEKPQTPKSRLAATGFYQFSSEAFAIARALVPSKRGELEITDLARAYIEKGDCGFRMVEGKWFDAGTFDSLLAAGKFIQSEQV